MPINVRSIFGDFAGRFDLSQCMGAPEKSRPLPRALPRRLGCVALLSPPALLQRFLLLDRRGLFRLVEPRRGDALCRHADHGFITRSALDRRHLAAAADGGIAGLVAALLQPDLPFRFEPMVDIAALPPRAMVRPSKAP